MHFAKHLQDTTVLTAACTAGAVAVCKAIWCYSSDQPSNIRVLHSFNPGIYLKSWLQQWRHKNAKYRIDLKNWYQSTLLYECKPRLKWGAISTSFPGSSLFLPRESTLVSASHVSPLSKQLPTRVDSLFFKKRREKRMQILSNWHEARGMEVISSLFFKDRDAEKIYSLLSAAFQKHK